MDSLLLIANFRVHNVHPFQTANHFLDGRGASNLCMIVADREFQTAPRSDLKFSAHLFRDHDLIFGRNCHSAHSVKVKRYFIDVYIESVMLSFLYRHKNLGLQIVPIDREDELFVRGGKRLGLCRISGLKI